MNANQIAVQKWTLVNYPEDHFVASRDAKYVSDETIELDNLQFDGTKESTSSTTFPPDHVVVQVEALSVDAFIRTMLDREAYHGSVKPGAILPAMGYGVVRAAGPDAKYKPGSRVTGILGATTVAILPNDQLNPVLIFPRIPSSLSLGYLGLSGLTAYVGLFGAPPKAPGRGDTVVVSAAAGAVGHIAAQMARLVGATRVVGIAGGPDKKAFLLETLGLDGAIDYKDETQSLEAQLDTQCPDGVDFFFDSVGGDTLETVLSRINQSARVVICGAISQYSSGNINKKNQVQGPSTYIKLAEKSASMTGFNVMHHPWAMAKAIPYLVWHYYRGNIHVPEHVEGDLKAFPSALESMFEGGTHCGRLLIDVDGSLGKARDRS
jgi:hypothetical protein